MKLALDKESVRTKSVDGHLHIAMSNMSKACVNPYYGHEIPDADKLGLDADRIYYLLRDPEELKAAAPTFNNLPILADHVPVNAEAPQQSIVIGSTGTDAHFDNGFLRNSSVIWVQDAIDDLEAEEKTEWSCAYHYRADMTPGNFQGLRYDGIMRDMIGNHVALVDQGRAGRDVVVGDSMPGMHMKLNSRAALMLHGAVAALVAPRLAMDSKLDLSSAFAGVTAKNLGKSKGAVAARVVALVKPKLAQDGELEVSDVVEIIDAMNGMAGDPTDDVILDEAPKADDKQTAMDDDGDVVARIMAYLEGKLSDEDMTALGAMVGGEPAKDEAPDAPPGGKKPAMDADAIRTAARNGALAEMNAIRTAERAVEPIVGKIAVAMDSAAAVYRFALDHAKVDHAGINETKALAAMVAMIPETVTNPVIALDHASVRTDFHSRFPNATKLVIGG